MGYGSRSRLRSFDACLRDHSLGAEDVGIQAPGFHQFGVGAGLTMSP